MRRWLVLSLLLMCAGWGGCSGDAGGTMGNGGAAASSGSASEDTASTAVASSSGSGGANTCVDSMSDGKCDPLAGEDCDCVDCTATAVCIHKCDDQAGVCDAFNDSCTCPDCFTFHACSNPTRSNCNDQDGTCDPFHEGCNCIDCAATQLSCADAITLCKDGKLDQQCENSEPCGCPDCFGTPMCLSCTADGICAPEEPCFCADCADTNYCLDPANCHADGICDAVIEGCGCEDCALTQECNGMMP